MTRIILYTGKGGVGKTSVAAATACKLAEEGKKTLILSTDQAHSLGDSFDRKLGNTPERISDNLYAMEIDTVEESEKAWGSLKSYLKRLLTLKSGESIETEELLVFPGLEELFSLFKILEFYERDEYGVLIVDCAPTGETMSLLKFPEMFENLITRFLPMERKAVKVAGPLVEKAVKIPMPELSVFDDMENLSARMAELRNLMSKKDTVSIRIVTTPENIVIRESRRNFSWLHLYDYNVDAVIVNRIYPKEAMTGYFSRWIENQEKNLQEIRDSFTGIPIFYMELLRHELRGQEILMEAAEKIYNGADPSGVLFQDTIFTVDKQDDIYWLRIALPFVDKNDMELCQKGEELSLTVKNQHRNFMLPPKLRERSVTGAKYENGRLHISFS